MEDNKVLEVQDEIKEVEAVEVASASKKQTKKELIKEDPKDVKIGYDVVLVFDDYKSRLDKYFEIDGKIVYDRFGKETIAKAVADKLMARGILVEIKSIILN